MGGNVIYTAKPNHASRGPSGKVWSMAVAGDLSGTSLEQCLCTSSHFTTWELGKNAESQTQSRLTESESAFNKSLSESLVH